MNLDNVGAADKNDILYIEKLNKKLEKTPYDYDTLLRKALLLYYPFYKSDEAEQVFETLAQLYPNEYDVYFWHGESLYVCDANYEKAEKLLRKALSINSNKADAYILLAQTLKQTLRIRGNCCEQEIEKLFRTALQLEPYWPNAWYGLIYSLMRQKRYVEARLVVQDALQHIPTDYVDSDDIIQGRHDELVSGRDWTSLMEEHMRKYLQDIDKQEAEENNENGRCKTKAC